MIKKAITPPTVDELLNKLDQIDLDQLDVQKQLIALRAGKDWNFFTIPVTVLLLFAGVAIGLNLGSMVWGFVGGALTALLVGYGYHLWDLQWKQVATENVIHIINNIEGSDGFITWFKPILAKKSYHVMFYKLNKLGQIEITDYVRALRRLLEKDRTKLREQLTLLYPATATKPDDSNTTDAVV
ncbi:MAG: hypothetical protein JHC38_05735 [Thiotrichales bacterium]|jgi:hypothetical protein|nr:hypothetical protein [Thiotrichales bacterium]